jgi:uncharacterized protein YndB with AHSA1/START domain
MASAQPQPETKLEITRTLSASREKVFRAWTEPEAMKRWWIPRDGFSVPDAQVDLRVGGRYRVAMRNPQGEVFHLGGEYREVTPPERLVYTFRWELASMDVGETLVTVDFRDRGEATEIVLRHERFPTAEARDNHRMGWTGTLDHLEKTI